MRFAPMPDAPLVSVVTPSFNQGGFIAQTIASVLDQDYPHIEYLIVDGGSTDATRDVLRRFGGRLRWISEPDRGQTDAINKGWRQVRGQIVAWLNADDLYLPHAVAQVVAFFQAHPEVDAVYGDCDYIDAHGQFIQRYSTRPYDYLELVRTAIDFIPQPTTFLRRRVLEAVGPLDDTLHHVLDFEYWLRLGLRHTVAYLPVRLAAFRLHSTAKSVRSEAGFGPELIQVYRRLFARPDLPPAVRSIEAEAMASVHYMAAVRCFWGGSPREARQYARVAWSAVSGRRRRKLALLIGLGTLGQVGVAAARAVERIFPRTL